MKTLRVSLSRSLWLPAALLLLCLGGAARAGSTFNVMNYGAAGNGTADDTVAVQNTINAAIAAGSGNTVYLPAGTYLIAGGPQQNTQITITGSTNLTFEGAGTEARMLRYTRADLGRCFAVYGNTNVTIQDFSADVQKLPATGQYDLGETQGTITAVSRTPGSSTVTLTVQVEQGYPPRAAPTSRPRPPTATAGPVPADRPHTPELRRRPLPHRRHPDGQRRDGDADPEHREQRPVCGRAVADLHQPRRPLVRHGLRQLRHDDAAEPQLLRRGRRLDGQRRLPQRDAHLQQPLLRPAALPARPAHNLPGGLAMGGRGAFTVENSTFLRTWDDDFDIGGGYGATVLSQPAPNQVLVSGTGDYEQGDQVEFSDNTDAPRHLRLRRHHRRPRPSRTATH